MEIVWGIGGIITFIICKSAGRSQIASVLSAIAWPLFLAIAVLMTIFQLLSMFALTILGKR